MKQILFIGNSHTYYNDMAQTTFAGLARKAGLEVNITTVTRGGYFLHKYADPEDLHGARLREVIQGQHYDYVVLQDQSLCPVTEPEKFFRGVEGLHNLLKSQADRFVLYATWSRHPDSPDLQKLGLSFHELTQQVDAAYCEAGSRVGARVAHVGLAFEDSYAPELFYPDMIHASPKGSALAARVILDTILEMEKENG